MAVISPLGDKEINHLTLEFLKNSKTVDRIYNTTLFLSQSFDSGTASKIIRKLNQLLGTAEDESKVDISLFKRYQDQITLLKFIKLSGLPDKEVEELFRTKLLFALKSGINLKQQADYYIRVFGDYKIGFRFVSNVIRAMSYNEENLGERFLEIEEGEPVVPPMIKNWIRSYNSFFKLEQDRQALEEREYLTTDKNASKLSGKDRELLFKVIKLYDFLRFLNVFEEEVIDLDLLLARDDEEFRRDKENEASEQSIFQTEDRNKTEKSILTQEEIISFSETSSNQVPPAVGIPSRVSLSEIIPVHYLSQAVERAQVEAAAQKFSQASGQNFTKIIEELYQAVYPSGVQPLAKIKILAYLRLLAAAEKLDDLLEEERFAELLINYFKNRGQLDQIADFRLQPTAPKFLRYLLAYILEERLGLTENETARWGIHFANLMKQAGNNKYLQIAYYDIPTQQFKWK